MINFPIMKHSKQKTNTKKKYSYLPTQLNIQGRGTANKQFFKDGPTENLVKKNGKYCKMPYKMALRHWKFGIFAHILS